VFGCPTTAAGGSRTEEESGRVPTHTTPGRSLVTRRALIDMIRAATLGSYGVTGFAASPFERLVGLLGLRQPGIGLRLDDELEIELDLTVAYGVPIAEVARQVDSAVRYSLRRALSREVGRVTIHVGGLRFSPGTVPPSVVPATPSAIGPRDLADSGTDVA
jgi:uncharacterized alkaline shock family protein YloU